MVYKLLKKKNRTILVYREFRPQYIISFVIIIYIINE